jgi:hypothetical protein
MIGSALLALGAGCAPPGALAPAATHAAAARVDPQDSCGPQVVVFVSAGDLFATPPRRTGTPSAAALAEELARENAALERLQIAFDALMYCRWTEVRVIRADAGSGVFPAAELPRRLGAAEARLRQDVARATEARSRIAARSARIEQAVEAASPGTRAALAAARVPRGGTTPAVASASVVLRARPDAAAPLVGTLEAGRDVQLRAAAGGFVLADAGRGLAGYAPGTAFTVQAAVSAAAPEADRLRSLAATNIARRDAFAQSVELANRSGVSGFEPGG